MPIALQYILVITGIILVLLCLVWIFVPVLSGLPWIPTHRKRIRKALELSEIRPDETFYDLGAGDGRVLIHAAREHGARAVGIEISPTHCFIAWLRALFSGVHDRVSIRLGNLYSANLEDADVVYAYLTPAHAERLKPHLEAQLCSGARVVTVSADLDGWQPTDFDPTHLIFLYHMPPSPGGLETYLTQREFPPA